MCYAISFVVKLCDLSVGSDISLPVPFCLCCELFFCFVLHKLFTQFCVYLLFIVALLVFIVIVHCTFCFLLNRIMILSHLPCYRWRYSVLRILDFTHITMTAVCFVNLWRALSFYYTVLQKVCHPACNNDFESSCPIQVIFGVVVTEKICHRKVV